MATLTASSSPTTYEHPGRLRQNMHPWVDFFLFFFMMTNLAWSMNAAQWSPGLEKLLPVVVVGVIAGTLLALSRFRHFFAMVYVLVVGTATILWSLAGLAPEGLEGQARVFHVLERTMTWAIAAYFDQPVADNMVFVLVLAIILWTLVISATWSYFRQGRKWQAVVPAGLAMLINLYYAPPQLNAYFVIYLLCAILLLVRATLYERESEWRRLRVHFPFDISFDFMRDGLLFALLVIFASWVLPNVANNSQLDPLLEPLQGPWRSFQQDWSRLFSTVNYGQRRVTSSFGTSLTLDGPRNVTDEIIMDVKTPVDRYYRAVVLDTYLQGGWILGDSEGIRVSEENAVDLPRYEHRREITQTVTVYQPGNVLAAAPQPQRVMLPVDARIIPLTTEAPTLSEAKMPAEYAMLVARRSLNQGDSYVVVSSIVNASEADLRSDSTAYPEYIKERYLQLPDTIPQRVFDLAEELAGGADNPYDIAKRIESYLRNYAYNDQIPGPAPGQDPVDYFLFEERQGYCNYYASSLAVMLRHLGIPTRLAVGYATGEYQPQTESYRLRDKDSHTWVEVYFPTYGWVEFEPTASEPALFRPAGELEALADEGSAGGVSQASQSEDNRNIPIPEDELPAAGQINLPAGLLETNSRVLLFGSILGILGLILWTARRLQRPSAHARPFTRAAPEGFTVRLWDKLMRWARRLHIFQNPSLTPLEQARAFARTIPEGSKEIQAIAEVYARDLYSPHPITTEDANEAQLSWLNLRPLLWRRWLAERLRLPAGIKRALFAQRD